MSNDTMNTVGNGQPGAPGAGAANQAQAAARDTAHKAAEEGSALVGTAADQAKDLTHQARQQLGTVTDEAGAMEAQGHKPLLVPGGAQNFKVTYPDDFALAEAVLRSRAL